MSLGIFRKLAALRTFEGLEFYRCQLCGAVVSVWDIRDGGCPKCDGVRIMPTKLSLWEFLTQLWKHPAVWNWPDQTL